MNSIFLSAEWRKLVMANYVVDPSLLLPYLPYKTELDCFNNQCYLSLVGFRFLNTKLKGVKIPFHSNFEEVNLRFYVRFKSNNEWKRGVVFIKEIVPKPALAFVANTLYKENYDTMPMKHEWKTTENSLFVSYQWNWNDKWNQLSVSAANKPMPILQGSEAEFITEHYWGYTKLNDKKTSEYEVEHPRWKTYLINSYEIDVDFASIYDERFSFLNKATPTSVFLAEGSIINVRSVTTVV
ncbi:YqjF family protein [Solitalea canadensis]|uniref:DUF2071 domain-containing protein n=1 Tax=Solitalea canadensis (strain ATCC 29591 / DSM 3403 / JCM 21819 / LMG 8368 / NBRC 15130 / NCIMB 12057 / USAM 9D) TaxID=929556 RepID=H8KP62_SOLCM|nr:DUF2071 domain-containing protein [Solitalea canadensis]AFD05699.1 hypothetical protein Solca_0569 [Solitalea canadensis DSM 3403]